MIIYLKRLTLATGETVLTLATEEAEKELDVILQKRGLADKCRVKAGTAEFTRATHSVKLREKESRLKNLNYKVQDKPRLERELELLKEEESAFKKAVVDTARDFQLALQELREREKAFSYIPIKVLSLEDILKIRGGVSDVG